jgi:hypothetical protein
MQASVLALHMQPSVISIGDVTSYGTAAAADTPERARVGVDPTSGKPCIRCEGVSNPAPQHGPAKRCACCGGALARPDCRRVIRVYGGRGFRLQNAAAAAAPAAVTAPASRNAVAIRASYVTGAYISLVRYSRCQAGSYPYSVALDDAVSHLQRTEADTSSRRVPRARHIHAARHSRHQAHVNTS